MENRELMTLFMEEQSLSKIINVAVAVEGQTENAFVKEVLAPCCGGVEFGANPLFSARK